MLGKYEAIVKLGKNTIDGAFNYISNTHGNRLNGDIRRFEKICGDAYDKLKPDMIKILKSKEGKWIIAIAIGGEIVRAMQPITKEFFDFLVELKKYEMYKKYELKERMLSIKQLDSSEEIIDVDEIED